MQQLNSKNYSSVSVSIRDIDKPIQLDVTRGLRLMDYLTTNQSTHVKITLEDGTPMVVKTTDIQRVEPNITLKGIEEYV